MKENNRIFYPFSLRCAFVLYQAIRSDELKSTITDSYFAAGCLRNLLPGSAPISLQ